MSLEWLVQVPPPILVYRALSYIYLDIFFDTGEKELGTTPHAMELPMRQPSCTFLNKPAGDAMRPYPGCSVSPHHSCGVASKLLLFSLSGVKPVRFHLRQPRDPHNLSPTFLPGDLHSTPTMPLTESRWATSYATYIKCYIEIHEGT